MEGVRDLVLVLSIDRGVPLIDIGLQLLHDCLQVQFVLQLLLLLILFFALSWFSQGEEPLVELG